MNLRVLILLLCPGFLFACASGEVSKHPTERGPISFQLVTSVEMKCPAPAAAGSNTASGSGRYYLTWSQCASRPLELLVYDLEDGGIVDRMRFSTGDYSRIPNIRTTETGAVVLIQDPFVVGDSGKRRLCSVTWDDSEKLLHPKLCADEVLDGAWTDAAISPDGKYITVVASKIYPGETAPSADPQRFERRRLGHFEVYELDEAKAELRQIRRVERFGLRPEIDLENSITRVLPTGGSEFILISVRKISADDETCRADNLTCLSEVVISYDVLTGQSETILNLTSERREGRCWVLFDHFGAAAGMAAAHPEDDACEYVALDVDLDARYPLGTFYPESVIVGWVDPLRFRIATRHLASPIVIQRLRGRLGMFSSDGPGAPPVEIECRDISAQNCQRVEGIRTSRANVLVDTGKRLKLYILRENHNAEIGQS